MKKALLLFITVMLLALNFVKSTSFIIADDDSCELYKGDKTEYKKCLDNKLKEMQEEIDNVKKDKKEADNLAKQYAEDLYSINDEMNELLPQIEELEISIQELEYSIALNEDKVGDLNKSILNRMVSAQGTMHFNPFLDFLLGSTGFADMIRRSYGLSAITSKEEADINEIKDVIELLQKNKEELNVAKNELETKKLDLDAKKEQAAMMLSFYKEKVAELDAEIEELREKEAKTRSNLSSIVFELDDLINGEEQFGFIHPVASASISAGIPAYPDSFGGGMHIGIDYAAGYGTNILAPADGVIVSMVDICESDRGNNYGSRCPLNGQNADGETKGMSAGGNQLRMICSVNGVVYGLLFFHMLYGSVHTEGVVTQGTVIGQVGSSGNSTGAHCHIELFYLGSGDAADIPYYINEFGVYSGFGTSYNTASLCYNKGYAACRLDGRDYFGKDNVTLVW